MTTRIKCGPRFPKLIVILFSVFVTKYANAVNDWLIINVRLCDQSTEFPVRSRELHSTQWYTYFNIKFTLTI